MLRRDFLRMALLALTAPAPMTGRNDTTVEVTTQAGTVRGRVAANGIRRFLGVPFAQPPVGSLRFRAPQPAAPWTGVRDAFRFAPAPIQPGRSASDSSEDCLALNLWVPAGEGPYPVFVWIHGGGNAAGWSGDPMQDGTTFARAGILCVTLSYRVGALGFLELGELLGPDYRGSGNNGLRDLALGLRWVHDNIAAFGGDPSRITLAGESAGGKDVAALLALPDTAGQIRRAIIESGSGQTVHPLEEAQAIARQYLGTLGLTKAEASRLRDLPAHDLAVAQGHLDAAYPHAFPFRAVVDGSFLARRPVDAVAAGSARGVSLIVGTNRDESLLFFPAEAASHPIGARELANAPLAAMATMEARYRQRFPETTSDLERRIRLLTAEEYWIPSVRLAEAHAASGGETRMYRFDHVARTGAHAGYAVHASELAFVWDHLPAGASPEERALARTMHGAWATFTATGMPHASGLPDWPVYDRTTRPTLIFRDTSSGVADDPDGAQRALWEGIL